MGHYIDSLPEPAILCIMAIAFVVALLYKPVLIPIAVVSFFIGCLIPFLFYDFLTEIKDEIRYAKYAEERQKEIDRLWESQIKDGSASRRHEELMEEIEDITRTFENLVEETMEDIIKKNKCHPEGE